MSVLCIAIIILIKQETTENNDRQDLCAADLWPPLALSGPRTVLWNLYLTLLYSCSIRMSHEKRNMIPNLYFYEEDSDFQIIYYEHNPLYLLCLSSSAYLFHLVELYLHVSLLFKTTSMRVSTQSPCNLAPWEGVFPGLFSMWEGVVCQRHFLCWPPSSEQTITCMAVLLFRAAVVLWAWMPSECVSFHKLPEGDNNVIKNPLSSPALVCTTVFSLILNLIGCFLCNLLF